ncbi:MAG: ATP-binding cassette domain-containing protein, partial [Alphaproteobacteria bacterium]|nr:ATP-binding cassette domain-containing protein [Alphaproteobacteria bacterium]
MNYDLECKNIVKRFDQFTAVNDVSFSIPKGSFFSILGPSGCGKTTLLRMIAGFYEPDEGDIQIKGKSVLNVTPNKRPVNMVFQHLALFPMMNVAENIAYGLRRRNTPQAEIDQKVQEALERIAETLTFVENSRERYYESGIYRIKGEILLRSRELEG